MSLHYLAGGTGPPVVFLHGFPDYCRGWRHQLEVLVADHRVLAPDLRGFNLSGRPKGFVRYAIAELVGDVLAILTAEKLSQASIVGHDWGGTIAYWLALRAPAVVRHLVTLSTPHPQYYLKALFDPSNAAMREHVQRFRRPDSAARVDPAELSSWETDPTERRLLEKALRRSSPDAMMNYYLANIPANPVPVLGGLPKIRAPMLAIFGTDDPYVPPSAYDGLFPEGDNVTSVIALPRHGHFIHHEAAAFVTDQIRVWIARPPSAYRHPAGRAPLAGAKNDRSAGPMPAPTAG